MIATRMPNISRWLPVAAACVVVGFVALQVRLVGDWRVDDAYITFSYSRNLAIGRGPVYGYDLRVEGYSNFLWMVFVALPLSLWPRGDPALIARIGAFGSLALLGWIVWRLMRRRAGLLLSAALLAVLALWTDLTRATLSGLETTPHAALLALCILLYTHPSGTVRRWTWLAALGLGLIRIDGFVLIGVLVAWDLVLGPRQRRLITARHLWWFTIPVLAYVGYFSARWAYYGLPLPLPYYAKSIGAAQGLLRGGGYLWANIRALGLLAAVPVGIAALVRKPRADALLLWTIAGVQCVYVVAIGGDWMPMARWLIPVVPLFLVLVAWGGEDVLQRISARGWMIAARVVLPLAMLFIAMRLDEHIVDTPLEAMKISWAEGNKRHFHDNLYANRDLVRWMLRRPGQKLVTDYGGVFAYYTDARIIEMWGLCNRDIALYGNDDGINPIYGKTCVACYPAFDPDFFHVVTPLARPLAAFSSHQAVIEEVFQGPAIDRVLDLQHRFVTGCVVDETRGRAFYFLERRRPGASFETRYPAPGYRVEYPFGE